MQSYDIIIIGGGIVGTTLALALAQQTTLQIALLDNKTFTTEWESETIDARVSAITQASQRIFQRLHVWPEMIAKRINPFEKMFVWDAQGELIIDAAEIPAKQLGYIIEDKVLRASLNAKLGTHKNLQVLAPVTLCSLENKITHQELTTTTKIFSAKLIIGADGANSWVRTQAQIPLQQEPYDQTALVATVQTTLPHQKTAWQHFLPSGPLAFLPLSDAHTSSIVWSTSPNEVQRLLTLSDTEFNTELTRAFAGKLGKVLHASKRFSFDLQKRHAKQYIKPRLALVGDAAHTIHPMAGQGVNLGLLDAAALTQVITEAQADDFAAMPVLRRYERWRKGENATFLAFVSGLKNLFANMRAPVQSIRGLGLNGLNKLPIIKSFLADFASGNKGDLPALADCKMALSVRE